MIIDDNQLSSAHIMKIQPNSKQPINPPPPPKKKHAKKNIGDNS